MTKFLIARTPLRALAICCLLGLVGIGLWMIGMYSLAEYHSRQARKSLERQCYGDALVELEAALQFRPRSADLHLIAGRTARQSGKFAIAWDHLHRCRELQRGVSFELQLEEYLLRAQTGELGEVFPYLFSYLATDNDKTPLVLEALSHVYLYLFQFDNAWKSLEHWLALQSDNVEALFLRGNYYTLLGKREMAVTDLRRVLELDPKRIHARLLLAQTLQEMHHPEEATAEFEIAFQQEPMNLKARLGLASCYVDQRAFSTAEAMLQECSVGSVEDAEFSYLMGRIAKEQGRYAEAIPYLRAAVAARPSDDVACYHLILCYEQLGDEAASSKYRDLHERIKKDQERFLAITKEEKESLTSNPSLCCELGELCLRLGIERRGLHWLNAALSLDPHYRRAHEQLLHYYERLGLKGEKEAEFHRQQVAGHPTHQ